MAELARLREEHDRKKAEFEAKLAEFTRVKEEDRAADAALADARVSPMLDLLARSGPLHDPLAIATLRNTLAAFPEEIPPATATDAEKLAVLTKNERIRSIMREFAHEEFALWQHGVRVTDVPTLQAIAQSRIEHQEKSWSERVGISEAMAYAGLGGIAGAGLGGLATLVVAAPPIWPLIFGGMAAAGKFKLLKHRWDTHNLLGKGKHMWHENPTMWASVIGGIAGASVLAGNIPAVRQTLGSVVGSIANGAQGLGGILKRLVFLRSAA